MGSPLLKGIAGTAGAAGEAAGRLSIGRGHLSMANSQPVVAAAASNYPQLSAGHWLKLQVQDPLLLSQMFAAFHR
jgi:hypothetical protein